MKCKYLISCVGMSDDECDILEKDLNTNEEQDVWMLDKFPNVHILTVGQKYLVSLKGEDSVKSKKVKDKLKDNAYTYIVVNKPAQARLLGVLD